MTQLELFIIIPLIGRLYFREGRYYILCPIQYLKLRKYINLIDLLIPLIFNYENYFHNCEHVCMWMIMCIYVNYSTHCIRTHIWLISYTNE